MSRARNAVALAALLAPAAPGAAGAGVPIPLLAAQLGRTVAVQSDRSDWFDQGGVAGSLSFLWPWEDLFRFGLAGSASDLGYLDREHAYGDTSPNGVLSVAHRMAWSASWRVDALGPRLGGVGRSYATGSYGYYRFTGDGLEGTGGLTSGIGGTIGLGLERPLAARHTIALAVANTWTSDTFSPSFASVTLEWRWRI